MHIYFNFSFSGEYKMKYALNNNIFNKNDNIFSNLHE